MGGGGDSQVVGYKYYAGMHMVLCHGPIDRIRRMEVDRKVAWIGFSTGGRVSIDLPSLFGGESREGGIVGNIDVEMGRSTQNQNGYLQSKLGTNIPAFRGVVGIVLRKLYLGVNPYLKKWSFRGQRVYTRQDGVDQWYDNKAPIVIIDEPLALFLALDFSGSMDEVTPNGKTRYINMRTAIFEVLDVIDEAVSFVATPQVDLMLVGFGTNPSTRTSILRRDVDSSDIVAIKSWFSTSNPRYRTYFTAGVMDATAFFAGGPNRANNISFFVTDGRPSADGYTSEEIAEEAAGALFATSDVQAYAFNIDLTDTQYTAYMDNTPEDGVPVISGDNLDELRNTILSVLGSQIDLNPAHIIRECLTDPIWGMGYPESDMDDTSFEESADTLYTELMGMSLLWDRQIPIKDFIIEIIRHIDAALYVSRTTGKFVLKLIRDDYDAESLITLDPSNIKKITNFSRPTVGDLVNSITVNYWDYKTGNPASVTVQDPALIQMQNAVINTTIQYPGFTNFNIASKVAMRDLKTLSSPLINCTVETNQILKDYNIGDLFKLTWPDYDVDSVIVRITALSFGNGVNNSIKASVIQEKFDFADVAIIAEPPDVWEPPGGAAIAVTNQVTEEATYFKLVQVLGQTEIDAQLTAVPTAGYLIASAARPLNGLSARLWVDAGGGYEDKKPMQFCPSATLSQEAYYTDLIIYVTDLDDLEEVTLGTYCSIDNEIMRVDAIDTALGTVTVGRGVLDTTPQWHVVDSVILFWDAYAVSDNEEYVTPEVISAKITTVSSEGELSVISASAIDVTMDSRAIKPYLPGNILFNSVSFPRYFPPMGTYVTWVGRDRLQQTGPLVDFFDSNIGPEDGTTYDLEVYDEDDVLVDSLLATTDTDYNYSIGDELTDLGKTVLAGDGIFATVPNGNDLLEASYQASGLSGTVLTDDSGEGNTAVATNITATPGDTALVFNGSITSHVDFPNTVLDTAGTYAISLWLNLSDQATETALLNIANSVNLEEIYLGLNDKLFLYEEDSLSWENQGPEIPEQAKTHIVLVRRNA